MTCSSNAAACASHSLYHDYATFCKSPVLGKSVDLRRIFGDALQSFAHLDPLIYHHVFAGGHSEIEVYYDNVDRNGVRTLK